MDILLSLRRTLGRAIDCRRSRERSEGSRALEFNVDGGQSAARSRESPADEKIRLSGCCEPARQSRGGQQLLPSPASLRFNEAGGSLLPGRGISGSQPRRRSKRRVLSACAFRRANEVQSERASERILWSGATCPPLRNLWKTLRRSHDKHIAHARGAGEVHTFAIHHLRPASRSGDTFWLLLCLFVCFCCLPVRAATTTIRSDG